MELLRDDKVMSVTVPLSVSDFLCPVHFDGRAPSYFVLGGLVFTVMSAPYLEVRKFVSSCFAFCPCVFRLSTCQLFLLTLIFFSYATILVCRD